MESSDHDRNRTGGKEKQGPTGRAETRMPSNHRKDEQHDHEIGDDARETKKERKRKAVLLQERQMLEPGQRTHK